VLLAIAASVALAACAALDDVGVAGLGDAPDVAYVVRTAVAAGTSADAVLDRLGGEVLVWRPETGFGVVGVGDVPAGLLPGERAEPNRGVVASPVASVAAGAFKIWSGGHKIWSGGDGIGGVAADNAAVWAQVRLEEARALAPAQGAGVVVAVLDTGLDLGHPAFAGALADPAAWFDFVDGDGVPAEEGRDGDAFGHGTAVAGLVRQVAPGATILPLRVLDADGVGDLAVLLRAVDHAVDRGARVLNLSLGTLDDSDALRAVVEHAASRGVFVVASAGNTGDDRVTFPAAIDDDLTAGVGSVDLDDVKSAFSTYGGHLTLVAPGETLWSAFPGEAAAHWSGTSMAAPLVAGALALALGELGALDEDGAHELREALLETLVDVDELPANGAFGDDLGGRLDVAAFLAAAFDALPD
jgi:thermitase